MRFGIRSVLAAGKIWRAILLGLVPIALVIPGGNVALSQSTTGSSSFTITPFDCPNSTATRVFGINNNGDIVGAYFDSQARWHGFLRYAGGTTCNTIDPPDSTFTEAHGINNTGQIVGNFTDANGKHGFLYDGSKVPPFTSINVSGARETYAWGINGGGQIVGTFKDNTNGSLHGFVRDAVGGVLPFDFDPNSLLTMAFGINDSGQIVGRCLCGSPFGEHGFVGKPGAFLQFDLPNTPTFTIWPWGINGSGQIAGYIEDLNFNWHGFVRYPTGTSTVFDVQNAPFGTFAQGINDTGQVVGYFVGDRTHGFFGKPDPLLTVPQWYQAGIPGFPDLQGREYTDSSGNFWGPDPYDFEIPVFTIKAKGCAITALAMLADFWEGQKNASYLAKPTPSTYTTLISPLDVSFIDMGLFLGHTGDVIFNNFAQIARTTQLVRVYQACPNNTCPSSLTAPPSNSFPVIGNPPDARLTLDNLLRNNIPVILPIFESGCPPYPAPCTAKHFVVVTGKDSQHGTYLVNDPGDANSNIKTLNDLQSSVWASGKGNPTSPQHTLDIEHSFNVNYYIVFVDSLKAITVKDPNTAQALGIYSDAPVEFVLTDPQGRRTGFDPVTNTSFQEIPTSAYSSAIFRDEQNFSSVDPPPLKALDLANQMAGQYTLKVIGTGSGNFTVTVIASDAAGNWVPQNYVGTMAPGVSSQFTFQGGVITFAAFGANLAISPSHQAFGVDGTFTLGPGGAISPLTQPVTIQIGNGFLATIPAGSFEQTPQGTFVFGGVIQGTLLTAALTPTGGSGYAFAMGGAGAPNLPSANPVKVRLAIGSNGGSTSVNATFVP